MGRIADEDPGLQTYLDRIDRIPALDRDDELRLAERYQRDRDARAAHCLVEANLRYVARIALGYRGYGLRVADLIEEGNLGLLEAMRRFDPSRGIRFMTYAGYWIRAYILAHILKQRTLVGVGTGPLQSRLFFRLARERGRLTAALGERASTADIEERLAETFGTTPERIREMGARLDAKDTSLDVPVYRDGPTTGLEQLADPRADTLAELTAHERVRAVRERVDEVLRELPERERYIVDQRLLGEEEATLADIGRTLHLSRERVRQLEARIKGKLRRALAGYQPDTVN